MYWLFLHYGPTPLLDENIDINSDLESMIQYREKVDDVVNYTVELLDKAIDMDQGLPMYISSVTTEMGRITLPAAHCIKAKVLVTAASPLFNGNTDYADFLDPRDRQPFFNQTYSRKSGVLPQKHVRRQSTYRWKVITIHSNLMTVWHFNLLLKRNWK